MACASGSCPPAFHASSSCEGGAGASCSCGIKPIPLASKDFQQVTPSNALGSFNSRLQFNIDIPQGAYWDPSGSFLAVKINIVDTVSSALPSFGGYSMNTVANLFDSMQLLYNGKPMFTVSSELPIADTMQYRITKPNTVYDGENSTKLLNMFTSSTVDKINPIDEETATLIWRPTVLRNISKLPSGSYTLNLTPSNNYQIRAFKAINSEDSTTFAIGGFGTGGATANIVVTIEDVKFWAYQVLLPQEPLPSVFSVTTSVPEVQLATVNSTSYSSKNFGLDPLAKRVAIGFCDDRGDTDPRIDKAALKFYLPVAGDIIPAADQSDFLDRLSFTAKGITKPSPDMELDLGDGRLMYMYTQAVAGHLLTKEKFEDYLERGQYLLGQIVQGSCNADNLVVRSGFDNAADVSHAQMVVYQEVERTFQFDFSNGSCILRTD